ncbi:MAG: exo-alpha-sialidase [Planctomycetes bacterium]|nr:exo-alpha-sialidase [Planctomycetota bacterium]
MSAAYASLNTGRARYLMEPKTFIRHTAERSFIGPGTIQLSDKSILMAAPWGRPPANFEQLAATFPVPMLYRSTDSGRTWQEKGRMKMAWKLPGMLSDGGITFLRLQKEPLAGSGPGRLAFLGHRHVEGLHGGGLPVISFSDDEGESWTPARIIGEPEGVWYVMNDRMIEMKKGPSTRSGHRRLVVPVSHMPKGTGTYEGDRNLGLCFFSDDGGETWQRSRRPAGLEDARGMAEPCVAEVGEGRLLMLARTGSGCNFASWSEDGGDTWSKPQPTTQTAACSSLTLKTLPDGRLITFYNHAKPLSSGAFFPRTPLCYAVSNDGGRSWKDPVLVDESGVHLRDRQAIYPSICFTEEGMLIVYSLHEADPGGSFSAQYSHEYPDCGGRCCLLAYPAV